MDNDKILSNETSPLHVTSEIGNLKSVLLHRPGDELLNLPPNDLERLLFDDVPFLDVAQQEHDTFAEILREQGVEVLYVEKLMAEALDTSDEVREKFVEQWLNESGLLGDFARRYVHEYLESITDNLELVKKTMAGITRNDCQIPVTASHTLQGIVSANQDSESELVIDPMPNLYFTRDPFAVVGGGVNINRMLTETRNRETIYGQFIFNHHPKFAGTPFWYKRKSAFHTEGGDVLNLNSHALAVGISQRTEAAAIDLMAHHMFWGEKGCRIKEIYAFNIPVSRAFMHLDTVFTQIDVDKFTVHPGILSSLQVFKLTPGTKKNEVNITEMYGKLEEILAKILDLDQITLIPCGAGDPIAAAREQWNDGSNTLCVRPGTVCVYQRNNVTNAALEKAGLNLLVVPSAELSRGRGGPRCMSMPFVREDVD